MSKSIQSRKSQVNKTRLFAVTTGDSNGVGTEVTVRALLKLSTQRLLQSAHFVIFLRHPNFLKKDVLKEQNFWIQKLGHKFPCTEFFLDDESVLPSKSEFLNLYSNKKNSIVICYSNLPPPKWVQLVGKACLSQTFDAMVTAPLSKTLIRDCGFKEIGHTEILMKLSKTKTTYMTFLGPCFNVSLLTGHIPLSDVAKSIRKKSLLDLVKKIKSLPISTLKEKPVAVLGLNPHAGDDGIIGREEKTWIKEFCRKQKLAGPLPPDSAFLPKVQKKYSFYIALYHDQGLIPFKTAHGQDGVHLSLGLPFVRTSVDHGTAFDIFGKRCADSTSMELAVKYAIMLS